MLDLRRTLLTGALALAVGVVPLAPAGARVDQPETPSTGLAAGDAENVEVTSLGCTPDPVPVSHTSTCSFEVANYREDAAAVDLRAVADDELTITGAGLGGSVAGGVATAADVAIPAATPGVPHTSPAAETPSDGFVPLADSGVAPIGAMQDETLFNYTTPAFIYGGRSYTQIGIISNGYLVVGGANTSDVNCCDLTAIGDAAAPNNVLAPFWTDLDPSAPSAVRVGPLSSGDTSWMVVEWDAVEYGSTIRRAFQIWIELGDSEGVHFVYDPTTIPSAPLWPLLVGAENYRGQGTTTVATGQRPTGDLKVVTGPSAPSTIRWDVTVEGRAVGEGSVRVEVDDEPAGPDATATVQVVPEPLPVVASEPSDLTVGAFQEASFAASATGGTLERWERRAPGAGSWTTVAGATMSPLVFTARGADSGAEYRAIFVNNSGDEVASEAATLTVERNATTTTILEVTSGIVGTDTPVWLAVQVVPAPGAGSISLTVDGDAHGSPVALDPTGRAELSIEGLAEGLHTIRAEYVGDDDRQGSYDELALSVLPADEAMVRRVYQVVLGREGEVSGVAHWVTRVQAGLDPSGIVTTFARSPEGRDSLVRHTYRTALDRTASTAERAYWAGRLGAGMTPEDLLATMLASPESAALAGGTSEGLARAMLDVHLDRVPGAAEVDYWTGRVDSVNSPGGLGHLTKQMGRVPEATSAAVRRTVLTVCGSMPVPAPVADELAASWLAHSRNPLHLAGMTLVRLCPVRTGPPA